MVVDSSLNDERQLIAKAQEDIRNFDALYNIYLPRVYRYLAVRTGDKALSEDLTSDTFIRAIESFPKFRYDGKPFGAWLFRIAHNLLIDHVRKNKKSINKPLEEAAEVSSEDNVEKAADIRVNYQRVQAALKEFSDEEREIILLKCTSGLKFSEIAGCLGVKENTVKTKYFRLLTSLKAKLGLLCLAFNLLNLKS